ncbi:MAG: hypothetical protein D6737_20910 [Chloroflexi bacterium]|nr:MAG: hypothetical protein D6737_20910 [Chloroflexota bacterium]
MSRRDGGTIENDVLMGWYTRLLPPMICVWRDVITQHDRHESNRIKDIEPQRRKEHKEKHQFILRLRVISQPLDQIDVCKGAARRALTEHTQLGRKSLGFFVQ